MSADPSALEAARPGIFAHARASLSALSALSALSTLSKDPLVALLFVLATVATLLPVWGVRYLPLLDYPNHLSIVFAWRHLHDAAWGFLPYYEQHLVPLPYWVQYGFVYALEGPLGVEVAQKLFLSLALLGLPLGLGLYARRLGRDPRLALFAFPLGWNYNVSFGFLSYAAGTAALFFALALVDAYATRPSIGRGLAAAFVGASLYFFHILSFGAFLAIGGVSALLAVPRPTLRSLFVAGLPLVPAAAAGLFAYHASSTMDVKVRPRGDGGLAAYSMIFYDPAAILKNVVDWLVNILPCSFDELCAVVLTVCLLLLLVLPARAARPVEPGLRGYRQAAAFVVAVGLLCLLPRTLHRPFYWYAINTRLALVVGALAPLWVRGSLGPGSGTARRALLCVAGLAAIALPLDVAAHFRRFNERARGFDEVMAEVPRGKRVLPIMLDLGDPDVSVNAYNQWGSYVQLRVGGYVPYNNEIDFPIRRRRAGLPSPPWDHPELFRYAQHGATWDYFVVHSAPEGAAKTDPFAGAHEHVRLVRTAGNWQLWQRL